MHSRRLYGKKLYFTVEGFNAQQTTSNAQQEALLHNRKFWYIVEKSILRQKLEKSSFCGRKVPSAAEKFLLQQKQRISPLCSIFPWTWTQRLCTNWQRQNGTLEPILRSAWPGFLLRKRNVKRTFNKAQWLVSQNSILNIIIWKYKYKYKYHLNNNKTDNSIDKQKLDFVYYIYIHIYCWKNYSYWFLWE